LGVVPDRRSEGLGSALLKQLEEEAVRLGATALAVDSMDDSADFYRRHGYVQNPEMNDELAFIKHLTDTEGTNT